MTEISPRPPANVREYTVSELSAALKRTVEESYAYVRVRGEISGFKRAASGHCYLALKDESAVLDAVCWRGTALRLAVTPEDGLEVVCTGKLTTYPARSRYQLVVDSMELAGEGALLKLLEERRKRLTAEGLFDAERKKPIPFLPEVIGVVTSPTGSVIRDILHRLEDRFPRRVLLWPVLVQGEGAAAQIAAAIEGFNRIGPRDKVPRPDLLIVARGGGSLEDLWAFNEEIVVRAAAASMIPLISAVGHETDTTLIDFASDRRAPTPTAAAEMAVPVRAELQAMLFDKARRLVGAAHRVLGDGRVRLEGLSRGLPDLRTMVLNNNRRLEDAIERMRNAIGTLLRDRGREVERWAAQIKPPRQILDESRRRVDREAAALDTAARRLLQRKAERFEHSGARLSRELVQRHLVASQRRLVALADLLESLSFRRVLERGYTLVRKASGHPATSAKALSAGEAVSIEFADGRVAAEVKDAEATGTEQPEKDAKPRPKGRGDLRQGRLL